MTTDSRNDLTLRLKAVPVRAFLRLPATQPFISAEILIGELCHEAAGEIERLRDAAANWGYFKSSIARLLTLDDAVYDRLGLEPGDSIIDGIANYLESTTAKEASS